MKESKNQETHAKAVEKKTYTFAEVQTMLSCGRETIRIAGDEQARRERERMVRLLLPYAPHGNERQRSPKSIPIFADRKWFISKTVSPGRRNNVN